MLNDNAYTLHNTTSHHDIRLQCKIMKVKIFLDENMDILLLTPLFSYTLPWINKNLAKLNIPHKTLLICSINHLCFFSSQTLKQRALSLDVTTTSKQKQYAMLKSEKTNTMCIEPKSKANQAWYIQIQLILRIFKKLAITKYKYNKSQQKMIFKLIMRQYSCKIMKY